MKTRIDTSINLIYTGALSWYSCTTATAVLVRIRFSEVEGRSDAGEGAVQEGGILGGLKRNILHLSNVTRVNKLELAGLREQVGGFCVLHHISDGRRYMSYTVALTRCNKANTCH